MGYLLKEALKTLCGVNQWSYAVFWKIGCQNPTLLIWEECYHVPVSCSAVTGISGIESSKLGFEEWEACWVSNLPQTPQAGVQSEEKVPSLITKMMLANRVKVVGQGLVGRAAFTGNHLWILSENYPREAHPPEVDNELCQQFSAGIKTVAVIPILTHGVVQFGSSSNITENMAFVNDVKNLILQVGCVPGALLPENYMSEEHISKFGIPIFHKEHVSVHPSRNSQLKDSIPSTVDSCNQQSVSSQALELNQLSYSPPRHLQKNLEGTSSTVQIAKLAQNAKPIMKGSIPLSCQIENAGTGVQDIQSNPELWLNQQAYQRSGFNGQPYVGLSSASYSNFGIVEEGILPDTVMQGHDINGISSSECIISQLSTSGGLASDHLLRSMLDPTMGIFCASPAGSGLNFNSSTTNMSKSDQINRGTSSHSILQSSDRGHYSDNVKCSQVEVGQRKEKTESDLTDNNSGFDHFVQKNGYGNPSIKSQGAKFENVCFQPSSGDDLFDIFGADFKNKLFGDSWSDFLNGGSESYDSKTRKIHKNNITPPYLQDADSDIYSVNGGNSDSIFSCTTGTDHLLDAVVSKVHSATKNMLDESVSCKAVLTNVSNSSVPNASSSGGKPSGLVQMQGELSGLPKSLAKLAAVGSMSFKSECSKEDTGNFSQTSSFYGSQISSWVEQGQSMKQSSSSSKRPDEVNKSNRKRLKPGENPRPRPKDRQMIQDRMKELREIVPNGAKLSIDALLERTIKHMLFLQSVTKHADKLKQNGESKIINKDGRLLLRDSFEGGRTWACELGSQSMVCPIIVEDLNPPRQMLVEMLCEERGLFLEIADIIRGLGLTILKGVMETRNNKIWARFAVEADRDVTRMEIFLSLVHLLEQTVKSSHPSCNGIENNMMINHQSFHQAASIPATGRPCSLQ